MTQFETAIWPNVCIGSALHLWYTNARANNRCPFQKTWNHSSFFHIKYRLAISRICADVDFNVIQATGRFLAWLVTFLHTIRTLHSGSGQLQVHWFNSSRLCLTIRSSNFFQFGLFLIFFRFLIYKRTSHNVMYSLIQHLITAWIDTLHLLRI